LVTEIIMIPLAKTTGFLALDSLSHLQHHSIYLLLLLILNYHALFSLLVRWKFLILGEIFNPPATALAL